MIFVCQLYFKFSMFHALCIFVLKLWFFTTVGPIAFLYSLLFSTTSKSSTKRPKSDAKSTTQALTFTHEWTIENFRELVRQHVEYHIIDSGKFSAPEKISSKVGEKYEFELSLGVRSDPNAEELGVFLRMTCEKQTQIRYRLSAIDWRDGRKLNTRCLTRTVKPGDARQLGLLKWFKHEDLLNAEKGYLSPVDGNFTIFCEIDISTSKPTSTLNDAQARVQKQSKVTFKNNLTRMLMKDSKFTDVSLVVAGGKVLRSHKALLAAQSPVFEAMFSYTNTKEALEKRVEIPDMTDEVCREFLFFVYSGNVKQMEKIAEQLLPVADKYQMNHLKSICESILCTKLVPENAQRFHQLAHLHNAPELASASLELINRQTLESLQKLIVEGSGGREVALDANRFVEDLLSRTQQSNSS